MAERIQGISITTTSDKQPVTAALLSEIACAKYVAVDTETAGLEFDDRLLGISVAWRTGGGSLQSIYVDVGHVTSLFEVNDDEATIRAVVAAAFGSNHRAIYFCNAPFDLEKLHRWRHIDVAVLPTQVQDIQVMARMVLPMQKFDGVALEKLVARLVIGGMAEWVKAAKGQRRNIWQKPAGFVQCYARADAEYTLLVGEILSARMRETYGKEDAERLLLRESDFIKLLTRMQLRGILLSVEAIQQRATELKARTGMLEQELAGYGVHNPNSAGQLLAALGNTVAGGLPKTSGGKPSTGAESLEMIGHPAARAVVEWRSLNKAVSTWLEGFIHKIAADGRIHPSFRVAGTISGRLSCTKPNMQAVPIDDRGKPFGGFMGLFIAPPGYELWAFDYRQAELRGCAVYARSTVMAQAFYNNEDIHTATAAAMWPGQTIDHEKRQLGKRCNYCVTYGGGAGALAEATGLSAEAAKRVMATYKAAFPDITQAQNYCGTVWESRGYIKLWSGRFRFRGDDEGAYKAFNQLQQGNVAELVKDAMLAVDAYLQEYEYGNILLQIHDSIELELRADIPEEAREHIMQLMRDAAPAGIMERTRPPIVMEVDSGRWYPLTEKDA